MRRSMSSAAPQRHVAGSTTVIVMAFDMRVTSLVILPSLSPAGGEVLPNDRERPCGGRRLLGGGATCDFETLDLEGITLLLLTSESEGGMTTVIPKRLDSPCEYPPSL